MAIIKTLLLQDLLRLGGSRLLLWTALLVCGYIQYTLANSASAVGITVVSGATDVSGDLKKVTTGDTVNLKCAATGAKDTGGFRFKKDGKPFPDENWLNKDSAQEYATKDITTNFQIANSGVYTCEARADDNTPVASDSPEKVTLTLVCTNNGGECGSGEVSCDTTPGNLYCKCKTPANAIFAAGCDACIAGNEDITCPGDHNKCNEVPNPNVCKCDYGGTPPNCDECDTNATCHSANIALPVCKPATSTEPSKCVECINGHDCTGKTDKPNCVNDKCTAATPTSPVTGTKHDNTGTGTDSKGTTTKASVTSSAGTVTSTACLVIASVVVALMN